MAHAGPTAIVRLDPAVVNRIAAGEVVQRPASALKELIENSLDAGATSITVTAKDGGVKVLQVQDNGHGVREQDLPILCERHTTSKLQKFEDLQGIQTLGFRGEALASISFVSHVTVITQTASAPHALRVTYHDGRMDSAPVPCAATPGTTILAEDMFYNVPLRRKGLRSAGEEHAAILDIVGRYAVYKAGVAFSCRRAGEARADLTTAPGASRLQNIRAVYGAAVAKEAVHFSFQRGELAASDDELACTVDAYVTGAGYSGKKSICVIFINGRAVDCSPLRRGLESVLSSTFQRPTKPFVFLDVTLPANHVDVNVHPTKKEVAFLHQDDLIAAVCEEAQALLLSKDSTRTFVQTQLAGAPLLEPSPSTPAPAGAYRPERLVRTDARALTLDAYLSATQRTPQAGAGGEAAQSDPEPGVAAAGRLGSEASVAGHRGTEASTAGGEYDKGVPAPTPATATAQRFAAPPSRPKASRDSGGEGAFAFMPTALEIGGLGAAPPPGAAPGPEADPGPPGADALATPATQSSQRQLQRLSGAGTGGTGRRSEASASLLSIQTLLDDVDRNAHPGLADVFKGLTFVGMASPENMLAQAGTRLYLMHLPKLLTDLAYQRVLRGFGEFGRIELEPAPDIRQLLRIARLQEEHAIGDDAQECEQLVQQAAMLADYFALDITPEGTLATIPALFGDVVPSPLGLPRLCLQLCTRVDWAEEQACFRDVATCLARLFGEGMLLAGEQADRPGEQAQQREESGNAGGDVTEAAAGVAGGDVTEAAAGVAGGDAALSPQAGLAPEDDAWAVRHRLLPLLRSGFVPGRGLATGGALHELTRLEHLYRVFERC